MIEANGELTPDQPPDECTKCGHAIVPGEACDSWGTSCPFHGQHTIDQHGRDPGRSRFSQDVSETD